MNRLTVFVVSILLAASPATATDWGNRWRHASNASVNSQFLSFPLPMTHWEQGTWQIGVSGGYSNVDAEVVDFKGPMGSLGYSHALFDGFGFYGLGFFNSLDASGGGTTEFKAPFARNHTIANLTGNALPSVTYSNVSGTVKQLGFGAGVVWDPFQGGAGESSLPIFGGVIHNTLKIENSVADYVIVNGPDAGQVGKQFTNGEYSFIMPFLGIMYSRNIGDNFKIVPSMILSKSLGTEPQEGRITGTSAKVFDISGNTETSGFDDANYDIFVFAPGFTVIYRPWGLGANIGATIFKYAAGSAFDDGIDKVATFNLSWKFGNYVK